MLRTDSTAIAMKYSSNDEKIMQIPYLDDEIKIYSPRPSVTEPNKGTTFSLSPAEDMNTADLSEDHDYEV